MTDRQLRGLSRVQLMQLLLEQEKEIQTLRAQLEKAESALESREILLLKAGSIAEASLQLNGVFEAAQAAANQYLENIERLSRQLGQHGVKRDEGQTAAQKTDS